MKDHFILELNASRFFVDHKTIGKENLMMFGNFHFLLDFMFQDLSRAVSWECQDNSFLHRVPNINSHTLRILLLG